MIPDRLLIHQATIVEPTVTPSGSYSDDALDYDAPASSTTVAARFDAQNQAERYPDGRVITEQVWTMFANVDVDSITSRARIVWVDRGLTFEQIGDPAWRYAATDYHHVEATVRLLEG